MRQSGTSPDKRNGNFGIEVDKDLVQIITPSRYSQQKKDPKTMDLRYGGYRR